MNAPNFAQRADRCDVLLQRLSDESEAYGKRVGGDRTTALYHQIGALQGHLRGLMGKVAEYEGTGAKAQAGCGLTTVSLGDASVMVEYEYEAGESPCFDVESPGVGPGRPECVTVIQALVNGVWIETDVFAANLVEQWENQILDGETESLRTMKEEADCARWEARQEALMERGYP